MMREYRVGRAHLTPLLVALLAVGCVAPTGALTSGSDQPSIAPTLAPVESLSPPPSADTPSVGPVPSGGPVAAIEPVSASAPTAEAEAVLSLCGAATGPRSTAIAGMGLVPHATDLPKYTYLWGTNPEIQTDAPAWAIQFQGKIALRGGWAIDPVCVVIGGIPYLFTPKQYFDGAKVVTPPAQSAPALSLPTLAP